MNELLRRLGYLWHQRRADAELADELEFHREMSAREGGMKLGNPLRLREESREAWGWMWLDRFGQDLRYAARLLRKSPGFTGAAVLMLALGIGANVAAFGFFNLILLSPLPVREPDTILSFERRSPERYASGVPYPAMAFYREHSRTLSAVMALHATRVAIENAAKPIKAHFVTPNYFGELGGRVTVGRALDERQAEPVAVLSFGFWQRHFGADPSIVGKTIRLNRQTATVIGVSTPTFGGLSLDPADVWLSIEQQPRFVPGSQLLTSFSADSSTVEMWGRLASGRTAKMAEAEMAQLAAELRKQQPKEIWENETLVSSPGGYAKFSGGGQRGTGTPVSGREKLYPIFLLMASLVLLILAVACSNLGGLLLARGVARQREMAIRIAVGAGSGRLVRQLFTESLLLAILGSAAGLAVGYFVLRSLMLFAEAPEWLDPTPDWRVGLFAVGIGIGAALLFGLTPAWQVARQRYKANAVRQFLIGAQVAASCVLLIVSSLLVRGINHAISMNPGFEYQQVVSINPGLATHGYSDMKAKAYLETYLSRVAALPGVETVTLVSTAPLGKRTTVLHVKVDDRSVDVHTNHVDPRYFEAMKIPLLRGRNLLAGEAKAVVIGESLARVFWPGQDPIGKPFPSGEGVSVVGVAGTARTGALSDADAAEAYFPIEAGDWPGLVVLAKSAGPPEALISPLVATAQAIDPEIFPEVQTLKVSFREKLAGAERGALAVTFLGLVALGLACLGIVGLVNFAVSQRTKEIGIRMALGARPRQVLVSVLRQFLVPVVLGLMVGAGGAAGLSQVLRKELYGISHLDPVAYLAAIAVFVGAAVLAALKPARQALRIDPLRALRYE